LSAHSEGEKKQWLDAMLASKKWYAAQAAAIANPGPSAKGGKAAPAASGASGGASTAKLEQELEEAETRVKKLLLENKSLKQQLEETSKGGNHEEMLLELEEMEERYEQEKKKRIALEKQAGTGKAGMVDEAELEALRDKYEEEIRFLKSQHQKDLRMSVKGKLPAQKIKKADSGDEDFDVPEFDDSYEEKSPRGGAAAKSPALPKGNSNTDALQREVEALKKENAKLKSQPVPKGGKAAAADPEMIEELRDEIQELNDLVQKLSHDVADLQADKQDLEKQLQSKSSGGGGGGGSSAKLQAENDELRNQIGDFEKQLDELEAGMANKNRTIRDLEAKIKAGGGKAGGGGGGGGGSAEADELRKKLELMEGVLEDLEQEIQDMKTANEDLTGRLQKAEAAAKKGGGGGGGKGNSDLEAENERLEEELAEAQNQASQYKAKLGLLRSEYKKLLSSSQGKK
jgi:chromosome segregation ATPase